jgi:hypothetical protein
MLYKRVLVGFLIGPLAAPVAIAAAVFLVRLADGKPVGELEFGFLFTATFGAIYAYAAAVVCHRTFKCGH